MTIYQQGSLNTTANIVPDLQIQLIAPQALLNGVPTNILGIVGTAPWGPVNSPTIASSPADTTRLFGPMQARKYDIGTAVYAATLQGAANLRLVRVTDGTDGAATITLATNGVTLTAKYTGTLGNSLTVTIGTGSSSTSGTPTYKVSLALPGQLAETFDNIGGTGNAFWVNVANAINSGQSSVRGPSQIAVATAGVGTSAPTLATSTLVGGTDGATTITSAVLVGQDTIPRKGMYALRGTGASVAMLADADDSTQWTYQAAFGLSEGAYMQGVSPAGDTIANFASSIATAGIDSYAMKILFGDWDQVYDPVNGLTRLISPQGFEAGKLAALSPQNSSLNKPMQGIIGTQKTLLNQQYSLAELQAIAQARGELITNPCPGGSYFGARFGRNTSSNAAINGDNYTRMTNYIASTLNAGMGLYIGQLQSPDVRRRARATLDNFLQNLFQQGMIGTADGSTPWLVVLDDTNNPQSRVALGYMQADVKVIYLSVITTFLVNLEAGQTVTILKSSTPLAA